MSAVMELVDDAQEFFAPVSSDLIDGLLGQYQQTREHIAAIADVAAGSMGGAITYFIEGNKDRSSGYMPSVERLFDPAGAIAALNAVYWSKAMALTDVYSAMPQARRDEWSKSISEKTTPEFTEDAVRPTISGLLADRAKFFAERVDGIFRGLSGAHVTNRPEGFSKRMIIANVTANNFHSNSKAGLINDLRAVIAKFMGRDEPTWNATGPVISIADRQSGQWLTIDGGALRIRTYKIGTAHLEVHPDMAYRLNQVLAGMYPMAIPSEFRTKPAKKAKEFQMTGRPLPFAVVDILSQMKTARRAIKQEGNFREPYRHEAIKNALKYDHYGLPDKHVLAEVRHVLSSIGGVETDYGWQFDYDPRAALDEIVASGCVPDQKAHQFYPTPEAVARVAVDMANIGPDDTVLEPSAGQGGIADYLPKDKTVCVEISKLHCDILRAKGFVTVEDDFIKRASSLPKFDCVVMNPPFSEGRAKAHVEAAVGLLKSGGRLVAVLPASFKGKDILPGLKLTWSQIFDGEFAGTSVSVVIVRGEKA